MTTHYILRTLLLVPVCLGGVEAAGQYRHEFSVDARAGFHQLRYSTPLGNSTGDLGYGLGLGYTYFINHRMGVALSPGVATYRGHITMAGLGSVEEGLVDGYGHPFEFRSTVDGYTERQQVVMLQVPLLFHYQRGGRTKFYARGGFRVDIPLSGRYQVQVHRYVNSAWYPQQGVTLYDPAFRGFGSFAGQQHSGTLSLRVTPTALAEAGAKWALPNGWLVYTGAYLEYGMGNILGPGVAQSLVRYQPNSPTHFGATSVLHATYDDSNEVRTLVGSARLLAVGVSLRIAWGCGSTRPRLATTAPTPDATPWVGLHAHALPQVCIPQAYRQVCTLPPPRAQAPNEAWQQQQLVEQAICGYPCNYTALSADNRVLLDQKVSILKASPYLGIICTGHTCNRGSHTVNQRLGLGRAQVAQAYMVSHGIEPLRIAVASMGEDCPLVPNTNEANRCQNRRVSFEITPQPGHY